MEVGAIIGNIDVAQVVLYIFWIFFAGLIIYLRREDRREGYPVISEVTGKPEPQGWLFIPEPKYFRVPYEDKPVTHSRPDTREPKAKPAEGWSGAPLIPTGDPMVDAVGPAAYAEREDVPDWDLEGHPRIAPLRIATDYSVLDNDPDPRGMRVVGGDNKQAGTVKDVWIDKTEFLIRYLEVELDSEAGGGTVLLPMPFARVKTYIRPQVKVQSIYAKHFANVPKLKNPDQVTKLEEDMISAYYGGGQLYADPMRQEPIL